jgi:hypothetical protein
MLPAHTLYVWSGYTGALGAPLEYWSFSLKSPPNPSVDQASRDLKAFDAKTAWMTHLAPAQRLDTHLTSVKVSQKGGALGNTLVTADGAYEQGEWTGDVTGANGGGATYPLQTAVVVSLKTARSGPTGKGRFYLPSPHFVLADDHRLTVPNATTLLTAVKAFVGAVSALPGGQVQVVSSKGYSSPVTAVKVGRVLDTLRSRRADQPEDYLTATFP